MGGPQADGEEAAAQAGTWPQETGAGPQRSGLTGPGLQTPLGEAPAALPSGPKTGQWAAALGHATARVRTASGHQTLQPCRLVRTQLAAKATAATNQHAAIRDGLSRGPSQPAGAAAGAQGGTQSLGLQPKRAQRFAHACARGQAGTVAASHPAALAMGIRQGRPEASAAAQRLSAAGVRTVGQSGRLPSSDHARCQQAEGQAADHPATTEEGLARPWSRSF